MSMLNIGTSALITSQGALSTTSHNISNVNTEGYNRQRVEQGTQIPNYEGGLYFGSGVEVTSVTRSYNGFLAEQVRTFTSQEKQLDTYSTFAKQVDDLLGTPELSLSSGLESFFDSVQSVADDPTSISARQVMLTEADTLANGFNTIDAQLDSYNQQINVNLESDVNDVNLLAEGIAKLNVIIVEASGGANGTPNDLLDQRDELINRLSEYVSVMITEESSGAQNVFIGNGQALVVGGSFTGLSTQPSIGDSTRLEVVYDSGSINLSNQLSGGSIGGLLSVRRDVIDPARAEIDSLAANLVTTINAQHAVGITLSGNAGGAFFQPTGTPAPDASNISLSITDPLDIAVASAISTTTTSSNTGTGSITLTSVDGSAVGFSPLTALSNTLSFDYDESTKTYTVTYGAGNTATIAYDPLTDSGKSVDLSSLSAPDTAFTGALPPITIKLSGVPDTGDSVTMTNSVVGGTFTAVGDNRNALAIANLQLEKTLNGGTLSYGDAYGILVANVATRAHQAEVGQETQLGLLNQATSRYESVSGVNLDEEAAALIKYQQAYQAASQIITVSNTVFNALINSL
jgi:flagellar hook-associated protein 1 FlgK